MRKSTAKKAGQHILQMRSAQSELHVALIILYDSDNRFLLQHRTTRAERAPGYWGFFGGSIKKGETPEDTVRREAFEELNYTAKDPKLIVEQDFKLNQVLGHMYVFIEAFDDDKAGLRLQEGQGWDWYKASEIFGLKMFDHDKRVIKIVSHYLENTEWKPPALRMRIP